MSARIGVIGTGIMGADHVRTLAREVSGATVCAVADVDDVRAKAAVDGLADARVHTDPHELVRDDRVDAVLVASSDATHEEFVLACLAAGKPVLCEKPLSPTVAGCRQVVDAEVRLARRLVSVGFMRRFDPGYVALRERLRSGAAGAALLLHHVHRNVAQPPGRPTSALVTGSAVHEIDVTRWLLDEEVVTVGGFLPRRSRLVAEPTHDPLFLVLETAGGVVADVEVFANAQYGYDVRCELVAERGTAALAPASPLLVRQDAAAGHEVPPDWRARFADAYRRELQDWVDALGTEVPSCGASAWDGYVATAVAERTVEAIGAGSRLRVDLPPRPALYDTA